MPNDHKDMFILATYRVRLGYPVYYFEDCMETVCWRWWIAVVVCYWVH